MEILSGLKKRSTELAPQKVEFPTTSPIKNQQLGPRVRPERGSPTADKGMDAVQFSWEGDCKTAYLQDLGKT